ncbi:MAG TPA: DNA-3-methyladenine glycosylase 2 family protein, partial [Candidatus Limnocylindria bacterium]|nr:DNA-3-methyladenine glycosylase 2 family protein [Candidatus Limnocylindria bacterium]
WGPGDPQMQLGPHGLVRAMRLASGPATLEISWRSAQVVARAWGDGASEALDLAPGLIGDLDDPPLLVAHHSIVGELARRMPGLRLTRGAPVLEMLVNSIIGQKVTGLEARRSQRLLLAQFGEPAPGPHRLRVLPAPEKLARIPYWAFHKLGLERRRADTIRAAAAIAPRLEQIRGMTPDAARSRLEYVPGIGPWTAAETMRLALGDPDAVSVGDFHLPRQVCWVLAGEGDGDDPRMLELLAPYVGQRARVVLLIERSGLRPARRAPRYAPRQIAGM